MITLWALAVSEKWEELTDAERARFTLIAEQWRADGPPIEVKRRSVSRV